MVCKNHSKWQFVRLKDNLIFFKYYPVIQLIFYFLCLIIYHLMQKLFVWHKCKCKHITSRCTCLHWIRVQDLDVTFNETLIRKSKSLYTQFTFQNNFYFRILDINSKLLKFYMYTCSSSLWKVFLVHFFSLRFELIRLSKSP